VVPTDNCTLCRRFRNDFMRLCLHCFLLSPFVALREGTIRREPPLWKEWILVFDCKPAGYRAALGTRSGGLPGGLSDSALSTMAFLTEGNDPARSSGPIWAVAAEHSRVPPRAMPGVTHLVADSVSPESIHAFRGPPLEIHCKPASARVNASKYQGAEGTMLADVCALLVTAARLNIRGKPLADRRQKKLSVSLVRS